MAILLTRQLAEGMLVCCKRFSELEPRIQQLGIVKWQNLIRADLHSRLISLTGDGNSHITESSIRDFDKLLIKYEKMEKISLLELTIWKAACIMEKTEELTYYAMLEWNSRGWKDSKAKMRRCSAIDMIIRNVLPFLY
jgi:hypothetical protein